MRMLRRFFSSDEATTSVEYAIMIALILMVCIVTVKAVGNSTSGIWANNQEKLEEAGF